MKAFSLRTRFRFNRYIFASALTLLLICGGCLSGPQPGESTSSYSGPWRECRPYFFDYSGATLDAQENVPLKGGWQLQDDDSIRPNDPISIVVNRVRVPTVKMPRSTDVAVVMFVNVSGQDAPKPLIVAYERNLAPGQALNFSGITVFSEEMISASAAPWIQVQVIDVKSERRQEVLRALDQAQEAAKAIERYAPSLADPVVEIAFTGARALIEHTRPNRTLINFKVQFYRDRRERGRDLSPLREGAWILVGQPIKSNLLFWKSSLEYSRPLDAVIDSSSGAVVDSPTILLSVRRAATRVPVQLEENLKSLEKTLRSDSSIRSAEIISAAGRVESSSKLAVAAEAFQRDPGIRTLRDLLLLLNVSENLQSNEREYILRRVVSILPREQPAPRSLAELASWWNSYGQFGRWNSRRSEWESPIKPWIAEYYSLHQNNSEDRDTANGLVLKLLNAARSEADLANHAASTNWSRASTTNQLISPEIIISDALASDRSHLPLSEQDREFLFKFFRDIVDDSEGATALWKRIPFSTASQLATWWDSMGQFGEISWALNESSSPRFVWRSYPMTLVQRIERSQVTGDTIQSCIKLLSIESSAKSGFTSDGIPLDKIELAGGEREAMVNALNAWLDGRYSIGSSESAVNWWYALGRDGKIANGGWSSPIEIMVEDYMKRPDLDRFLRFVDLIVSKNIVSADGKFRYRISDRDYKRVRAFLVPKYDLTPETVENEEQVLAWRKYFEEACSCLRRLNMYNDVLGLRQARWEFVIEKVRNGSEISSAYLGCVKDIAILMMDNPPPHTDWSLVWAPLSQVVVGSPSANSDLAAWRVYLQSDSFLKSSRDASGNWISGQTSKTGN